MPEVVFNAVTGRSEPLSQAVDLLYQQFVALQDQPGQIAQYDIWRREVKEKYPRDFSCLLPLLSQIFDVVQVYHGTGRGKA